jgi:hypothetical protein
MHLESASTEATIARLDALMKGLRETYYVESGDLYSLVNISPANEVDQVRTFLQKKLPTKMVVDELTNLHWQRSVQVIKASNPECMCRKEQNKKQKRMLT